MRDNFVEASPVKSFFVHMLTRDIELSDAILDLLDNCIDGILRTSRAESPSKRYAGYCIDIEMSAERFLIKDNCGGIPGDILKNYAFRMGRDPSMPSAKVATVGTFGIGMKRAIFKMGSKCEVLTRNKSDFAAGSGHSYKVSITPDWIKNESDWQIPYEVVVEDRANWYGTEIHVSSLSDVTKSVFDCENSRFDELIRKQIAVTYGFMIGNGLEITVNKKVVSSEPMVLKYGGEVSPYQYKTEIEGVSVFLAIGLTQPLSEGDGTPEEGGPTKYSAQCAGWTVICNDRVVLYADKTILTGWGEAGVPQFHPQYNPICGIVAFNSDDVQKLPITTTKRGVDASNPIYLMVKNYMREGAKACVKFTNDWKRRESEVKDIISSVRSVPFLQMKAAGDKDGRKLFTKTGKGLPGKVAKARLPVPERATASNKITCTIDVERSHLIHVAEYLDVSVSRPNVVVREAFNAIYREAVES